MVLRAFASGAAALTGVESISNGVNAFRPPQGRNAAKTLLWMGAMAISLFIGVSYLAVHMHASPSETVSVVSEIARGVFPSGSAGGWMYYAIQGLTFAVLILAANTSYQGFPRLSAVLARDRYFPRQFVNLGDRLVYSNGIIVLAGLASLLIWAFNADVNALIHLYVIGVFTAFTMSQSGMVRYWLRHKHDAGWRRKAVINGAGAVATSVVAVLVIQTKFLEGAWAVAVAIPILIASFYGVHRHYQKVARRLRAGTAAVVAAPPPTNQVVLYVDSYGPALQEAVWYARQISGGSFRAIHVPSATSDTGIRPRFRQLTDIRPDLEIVQPEGSRVDAVIDYLWALPRGESTFVTAIIPEDFKRPSLIDAVAHRTEFSLKVRLLKEPGVVVSDVPVIRSQAREWRPPQRTVCRVLVSGAHAASLRAVNYASTLHLDDTRALFFAFDTEEAERIRTRVEAPADAGPGGDRGGPLPRPRRPAARLPPPDHGRPGDDGGRRPPRTDLQRPAAAAAQSAGALHQAVAAVRAAGDPDERPVSPELTASAARLQHERLGRRVLEQPGQVLRREPAPVGRRRSDDPVEVLRLPEQPRAHASACGPSRSGVDGDAGAHGGALDRLEQRHRHRDLVCSGESSEYRSGTISR